MLQFPSCEAKSSRFNLRFLLAELAKKEFNEVHVEAGPGLVSSLYNENLIDEFIIYQSSKILGEGLPFIKNIETGDDVLGKESDWFYKNVSLIGNDIRIILRGKDHFDSDIN